MPVVGLLAGWLALDERLAGLQLAGVLLVLVGLIIIVLRVPGFHRRVGAESAPVGVPALRETAAIDGSRNGDT